MPHFVTILQPASNLYVNSLLRFVDLDRYLSDISTVDFVT